jgi:hypothetical protein
MSTEKRKIEPIFVEIIDGITVSAIWNLKNQSKKEAYRSKCRLKKTSCSSMGHFAG